MGLPPLFSLFAADVAIAPQSLTFAWQLRSQVLPPEQGILLTSPDPFTFTVSRPAGDGWLSIRPDNNTNSYTGTGPVYIPVNINPGAIGPGTFNSSITVRLPQGSVTIPVTFQVSPVTPVLLTDRGILGFDPTSLLLPLAVGLSNGGRSNIIPSNPPPWLTIRGSGENFITSVDPVLAGPTLSAGTVQLTACCVQLPANNPLSLPVVYMGSGLASRPPLTAIPSALAFTGSGLQTVAVTGPPFSALPDARWVTVFQSAQGLTVAVNANGLADGTYQATIVLNAKGVLQCLPITLTLGPPTLAKVVNASSYAEGGIAPGEVVALFGSNIGPNVLTGLTLDADGFVSSTLARTQVTFNGVAAPLLYVSATQVAAVRTYDLDGSSTAAVQVTVGGRQSNTVTVPVVGSRRGSSRRTRRGPGAAASFRTGDIVSVYLTGEGQTTLPASTGKSRRIRQFRDLPVTRDLDGQPAEVLFAGEAPGVVSGVMQVNLRLRRRPGAGPVPCRGVGRRSTHSKRSNGVDSVGLHVSTPPLRQTDVGQIRARARVVAAVCAFGADARLDAS